MDLKEISIDFHFVSANKWEYTARYHQPGFKTATMSITRDSMDIPAEDLYDLKQRLIGHVAENGLQRDAWIENHPTTGSSFEVF